MAEQLTAQKVCTRLLTAETGRRPARWPGTCPKTQPPSQSGSPSHTHCSPRAHGCQPHKSYLLGRLQMSLRKGKNLDLPLRLIGLKVGRKGPWKTPRPTWSSDKRGSPDSEIRSHLPKVTEVGRGRARLSPSPVLSTALLYLLSSAELSTSRRPPTFSDWLKDTRKGSAEPDTLPEQALAPRLKATTPCTSPPCHTGHTWRGLTPCGARTHAEPLRGIRVRLRQLPFHVRLGVLSKRLIRCHEATCCWAKRRFLVDSWPGQAGQRWKA